MSISYINFSNLKLRNSVEMDVFSSFFEEEANLANQTFERSVLTFEMNTLF
jgi:hypothetical protein